MSQTDYGVIEAQDVASWSEETAAADVVIVGLGCAGVCAAIEAREAGADVLVFERATALMLAPRDDRYEVVLTREATPELLAELPPTFGHAVAARQVCRRILGRGEWEGGRDDEEPDEGQQGEADRSHVGGETTSAVGDIPAKRAFSPRASRTG